MRSGRITRALAIGIAGALAMGAATPLYAQLRSNDKAVEQSGSNRLMPADTFLELGALSGNTTVSPPLSSRDQVAGVRHSGPGTYTMRRLDLDGLARNNNKGPDDYFAPTFRNGKCVVDEGNTLVTGSTLDGGVRKMEGKSLERALALLCRQAQESTRRVARRTMP
jgi:hypothetical protein